MAAASAPEPDGLFDLNIETVLEGWKQSNAVREFIANALDESVLSSRGAASAKRGRDDAPAAGAAPRDIDVSVSKGVWTIRDFGRGLQPLHLTQNESDEKLSATEGDAELVSDQVQEARLIGCQRFPPARLEGDEADRARPRA